MKHLEVKYIKDLDLFRVKIGRNEAPVTLSRDELHQLKYNIGQAFFILSTDALKSLDESKNKDVTTPKIDVQTDINGAPI